MSTLVGNDQTNILLDLGLFRVKVGGESVIEISDPGDSAGFALRSYVNAQTINDLATQDGNYNAQGHTFTNIATPVSNNDLASKQYTDDVAQISLGIANNIIVTSALTANTGEVVCGTTSLNMSN